MQTTGTSGPAGRVRVEQSAKRVRAYLGGEVVADSIHPRLVSEVPYYPAYYFPVGTCGPACSSRPPPSPLPEPWRRPALHGQGRRPDRRGRGPALRRLPDHRAPRPRSGSTGARWTDGSRRTRRSTPTRAIPTPASTSWRARARCGSRSTGWLASSANPRVLFETGLPPRWYLPKTDIRMDLLVPTGRVTHCPYKGQAQYWSVRAGDGVHDDLAWSYRTPLPESQKIAGLVAFYNEEVDLFVDNPPQQRPVTKFSRKERATMPNESAHHAPGHAARRGLAGRRRPPG